MRVHRVKFSIMKKNKITFEWKDVKIYLNGQEIKDIKTTKYNIIKKIPFNLFKEIIDNEKNRRN